MQLLAPDQSADDAAALVGGLTANASTLNYQELQSKLALNATALRALNQRRYDAAEAIDAAKADLQKQEAAFLVASGADFNPSNLRQWRQNLDAAIQKAAHLRNQEARLTALAGVLSAELHKRDQRRDYLIRERLQAKHSSQLKTKLAAARTAVAEAIAAQAWSSGGMSPGDILPARFFSECLRDDLVRDAVSRFAAAEYQQAEAEVKSEKMYGGQS